MSIIAAELTLIDENTALRARVAKLEAALDEQEDHWRWIIKAHPNSGASATADRAIAALRVTERLTPVAEGLGKYAITDELLALRAHVAKLETALRLLRRYAEELRWKAMGL